MQGGPWDKHIIAGVSWVEAVYLVNDNHCVMDIPVKKVDYEVFLYLCLVLSPLHRACNSPVHSWKRDVVRARCRGLGYLPGDAVDSSVLVLITGGQRSYHKFCRKLWSPDAHFLVVMVKWSISRHPPHVG